MDNQLMQKIIAVSGIKNSGKTTLITGLVRHYAERGLRVAVIKHDGHDFDCDIPGTDTRAFSDNGAYGTACFSGNRIFVHKQGTGENEMYLAKLFPEADIIFLEGFKNSTYDKIEVVRKGISDSPASNPQGRFLIATDHPAGMFDEKTADLSDIEGIAEVIDKLGQERYNK